MGSQNSSCELGQGPWARVVPQDITAYLAYNTCCHRLGLFATPMGRLGGGEVEEGADVGFGAVAVRRYETQLKPALQKRVAAGLLWVVSPTPKQV